MTTAGMKLAKYIIGFFPLAQAVLITLDYEGVGRPVHIIEIVEKCGDSRRSRSLVKETCTTTINVDAHSKTFDIETDNFDNIIGVKLHYADEKIPYTENFSKDYMVIEKPAMTDDGGETEDYQGRQIKLHYQTELVDFDKYTKPGTIWKLIHPSQKF